MVGEQQRYAAPDPPTDARLVQRVQAGDPEAFTTLFRRYRARVYRQALYLLGHEAEAEEVIQEVFLSVYKRVHTLRGTAAFSTWLYRLTANAAFNRLRCLKRRPEVTMGHHLSQLEYHGRRPMYPLAERSSSLDDDMARAEAGRLLQAAIGKLKPMDKTVVILGGLHGLSNREVADRLGLSVSAVKARLYRARLFLRGELAVARTHASHRKTSPSTLSCRGRQAAMRAT